MGIQFGPMSYSEHPNSTPSSFRSKLGSYATGLGIGFMLMGFFFYQKYQSQQRAKQRMQQVDQAPAGNTP